MKSEIVHTNDIFNENNFYRDFCIRNIRKNNKKCEEFYKKNYSSYCAKKYKCICPYGYSVIIFGDEIISSIIDKDSQISKIKKRDKYRKKRDIQDEASENYKQFDENILLEIDDYLELYSQYDKIKPLIHDLSNAISSCLDFTWKQNSNLKKEHLDGYHEINEILKEIKEIRSKYLSGFRIGTNYKLRIRKFKISIDQFKKKIVDFYEATESIQNLSDEEQTIVSGYELFNTFIDFYSRIETLNFELATHTHKPHKMLKKLITMLNYKAIKRGIKIEFTPESHRTQETFANISDVYIAFFSILENAIKYSKKDSTINIDIKDNIEGIIVTIENPTEKICEEHIPKLIEKGFTGNNSSVTVESSGYGLYLVDKIFKTAGILYDYECKLEKFIFKVYLK